MPLYPFSGEGSPAKNRLPRKKGTLILNSPLEDLDVFWLCSININNILKDEFPSSTFCHPAQNALDLTEGVACFVASWPQTARQQPAGNKACGTCKISQQCRGDKLS